MVAELSQAQTAALLFVPAVNPLKPAEEALEIAAGVILEWAARERSDADTRPLRRLQDRSPSLRPGEPEDDDVDLRVTRSAGPLWTLVGMVRVNRPWRLVLGLRGALAASVATAAFGLVSSPVWQVSGAISTVRLWIATAVSVITMVGWLILNHGLWQHADHPAERRQIRLYNAATVLTLTIGVLVSYLVVLAGNVMTAWFIVIPEVFAGYLRRPVEFLDYLRLAWLVASLATIGGALGSGVGVEQHRAERNLGIPLPPRPSAPAQEAPATGRHVDRSTGPPGAVPRPIPAIVTDLPLCIWRTCEQYRTRHQRCRTPGRSSRW